MAHTDHALGRHINPEAGFHAITADPVEQVAAEAAIRASWREFPYYARRYGERGWRFSLSDTGWIQTLCDLTPSEAGAQIRWLGGVLAARGMPQYLLERHLEHLYRELAAVRPGSAARYGVLLDCARVLRAMRIAQLDEASSQRLAQAFDTRVAAVDARVANMGRVLVAAVADERAGVAHAVESVTAWACDAARFPADWTAAVEETLGAARAAP
jgi:hypothetical protein